MCEFINLLLAACRINQYPSFWIIIYLFTSSIHSLSPLDKKKYIIDFHFSLYENTFYGQNLFKMLIPATLVWVLTSFITKIGALIEKL